MTARDLVGYKALVTGASAGIGAGIATLLASAGAAVVAVSRSGVAANGAHGLAADLSDSAQLDGVVDRALTELGGLDILVNNAGLAEWRELDEIDREYFDQMMALNVWAPLRLSQLARPALAESSNASITMIGSLDGTRPSPGAAIYGATKAGLAAVTTTLAKELADDGIRVNQVNPGLIETPMAADAVAQVAESGRRINLVGRVGQPDEVAGLVHYLVSPAGRFVNAAQMLVDGGALAMGPFDGLA